MICPRSTLRSFMTSVFRDKVQIEAIELVLGEDNALDDATPDSRDKVVATTMVQQFDKTFRQLFAAARTEVQIFETDGF